MRKDRDEAERLRKEGMSYKQIQEQLKIPKSTLSVWFSGKDWSKELRGKLTKEARQTHITRLMRLNDVRGANLRRAYEEARIEAQEELATLKYHPLFIAGVMLYWGEGDRSTRHITRLSNADPELIRFYVEFLVKACGIPTEKIRAQLIIYPDIDEESNRRFWAFASGLSLHNFNKSTLIEGRHKSKRLRYGVCIVSVNSTYFKEKMREWLKLLAKELISKEYYENIGDVPERGT